jgi:hypothetical protein
MWELSVYPYIRAMSAILVSKLICFADTKVPLTDYLSIEIEWD